MKDGGGKNKNVYGDASFNPFGELKKIIGKKGVKPVTAPPVPKKIPEPSDEELFAAAMKEVREIKDFTSITVPEKKAPPVPKACRTEDEALSALEEISSGQRPISLPDTQEYVEWINNGYRAGIIKKLKKGSFSVRDSIDLHGFTLVEAEKEIDSFLREALLRGYQCVKIIHGRGLRSPNGPVLKEAVIRLLTGRYRKHTAAFVTARQCDGGLGAVYVLLKRAS